MILNFFLILAVFSCVFSQNLDQSDCFCRSKIESRIVGGEFAENNEFPYHVSIGDDDFDHSCGGTIVNHKQILSSLKCLKELKEENLKVRVGLNRLNQPDMQMNTYEVERFFGPEATTSHLDPDPDSDSDSNFDPNSDPDFIYEGDIALIELKSPIIFVPSIIQPVCIDLEDKSYDDKLTAIGFGRTRRYNHKRRKSLTEYNSNKLKKLRLKEVSCERSFHICSRPIYDKGSICIGDGGSGLIFKDKGFESVVGLASDYYSQSITYTYSDGTSETYHCDDDSIFTKLSFYKEWFLNKVGGENYCKVPEQVEPKRLESKKSFKKNLQNSFNFLRLTRKLSRDFSGQSSKSL